MGKLYYLTSTRTNLGPIRKDVNAIIDLAPHDISLFHYLIGAPPTVVSAQSGSFIDPSRCDTGFITMMFPRNVLGHIHVSWLEPCKIRCLTLIGEKKMVVFDDVSLQEPIRIYDKSVTVQKDYFSFGEFQLILRDGDVLIPKVSLSEPLKTQCAHFVDCVMNGKKPLTDGAFGAEVVRVLSGIDQSIKSDGKRVSL